MRGSSTIDNRRAAAVFSNIRQRKILFALIARDHSLSELAVVAETPLNLLHHHVQKLIELGLVQVSGSRPRAGPAIKLYRATAGAFLVPAEFAGVPKDSLNQKLRDALELGLAGTYKGMLYYHDGTDAHMRLIQDGAASPPASEVWAELELSDADAGALAQELRAVMKRYASRKGKRRRRYIVHVAVASTRESSRRPTR